MLQSNHQTKVVMEKQLSPKSKPRSNYPPPPSTKTRVNVPSGNDNSSNEATCKDNLSNVLSAMVSQGEVVGGAVNSVSEPWQHLLTHLFNSKYSGIEPQGTDSAIPPPAISARSNIANESNHDSVNESTMETYGTYEREDDYDGNVRFSHPFGHDLVNGKFGYPIDATKNDLTALWGVVYFDPQEKNKHYLHASTETKMTRVRNLMPKQTSKKRNSTIAESVNVSPKFIPEYNHLTNFNPSEADDCPRFLTNFPGVPLPIPIGRPLPACAFVTEICSNSCNKKCTLHRACGKHLRPGDLCVVDGRDTYHRSKGVMFIGVYVLTSTFERGCKVGAVRTMYNDVASVTNRIGVIKYVAKKSVKDRDFFSKVNGYAHLHFVDQGRDFTTFDVENDHSSMANLRPPRLDDQKSISQRLRTTVEPKEVHIPTSTKKKASVARGHAVGKTGKGANKKDGKIKSEHNKKRKRSAAAGKYADNDDDSAGDDEWGSQANIGT